MRELLAADGDTEPAPEVVVEPVVVEAESAVEVEPDAVETEPESRLILETPDLPDTTGSTTEHATYLPLFVAPQPVVAYPKQESDVADEVGGRVGRRFRRRRRRNLRWAGFQPASPPGPPGQGARQG